MRPVKLILCMAMMAVLTSCDSSVVGSIQPLFTSADLVFDTALAGVWKDSSSNASGEIVALEPRGDNGYTMILRDDEGLEEARYEAWLVNLHGETFLDIQPEAPAVTPQNLKIDLAPAASPGTPQLVAVADQVVLSIEPDEKGETGRAYKTRFIRLHWFYKVQTDGRAMRLTGLSPDWLLREIDEGRILIDHQELGADQAGLVLSASTGDLQQLVLDYSFDPKAFPEDSSSEYVRAAEE